MTWEKRNWNELKGMDKIHGKIIKSKYVPLNIWKNMTK